MSLRILVTCAIASVVITSTAAADPPARVARIGFLSGSVSLRSSTANDWSSAELNAPMTVGDHLWTGEAGRVELSMGAVALDVDMMTAASILNLDYGIVQVRVAEGTSIARVQDLEPDESVEIDTPNGALTLLRPGIYRVDVSPNGDSSTITVRRGDAEIATGSRAVPIHEGQRISLVGLDAQSAETEAAPALDEFDDWALLRQQRAEQLVSAQYVSPSMVGSEDLDEYGTWRIAAGYGPVWTPRVGPGWVPYRSGHWMWVDPWGWTWIDDAAWGFAPFHYGRWARVSDQWVWVPGNLVARPVYAPALVAFVAGPSWGTSLSVQDPVGWFPLGPHEAFVPTYNVSPVYVAAVNRPNVAVNSVHVTVTNITYVNKTAGAVTVVPREAFTHSRPVATSHVAVPSATVNSVAVLGHSAPRELAPAPRARAAAPPGDVLKRSVVVRTTPSPHTTAAVRQVISRPPQRSPDVARTQSVQPRQPERPQRAIASKPAPVARAHSSTTAPDLAAQHAKERVELEAKHAAERSKLRAQHDAEAGHVTDPHAQADLRTKQARERADLDARQKREHEQLQTRQESERSHH